MKNQPKTLFTSILCTLLLSQLLVAQGQHIGIFDSHLDIGAVKQPGTAAYDSAKQTYTLSGAGSNMWDTVDEFQYLWKSIQGDFILRTQLEFVGEGTNPHRKIGWVVRNNFDPSGPHVNASVHGDGLTTLQYRQKTEGITEEVVQDPHKAPDVLQLERHGNTFILGSAKFGEPMEFVQVDMNLRIEVFVGLYICSHEADVTEKAVFKNVRIIQPAPEDLKPYRDYLASRLEVMDVTTGDRKVLLESEHSIQAPNWTPDGKYLIYNSNGFIYRYELATGEVTQLNTGVATGNNNDHVLSFDGSLLGISSGHEGEGSAVYYLPITGSDNPKRVTQQGVGASYFHGWSPDKTKMLFTGNRNGQFDIYEVDVASGKEKQLTDQATLDDGSEYDPEGKYIYFNSSRTGTMQVWRMKANGKDQTQLTFDELNDWFPHVSPDGKTLIFISFPKEVDPADHPFYKHCLLRTMPINGGTPTIKAYIYGGQGSMNTPSWSPDSKHVAFITNSKD